jgi:hypothetical protein
MDEGRIFVVETVQTMGRLIDVCIVLRHKLPSHFRWDDTIRRRRITVGRSGIRHDGGRVSTSGEVRLEGIGVRWNIPMSAKTEGEKNA